MRLSVDGGFSPSRLAQHTDGGYLEMSLPDTGNSKVSDTANYLQMSPGSSVIYSFR